MPTNYPGGLLYADPSGITAPQYNYSGYFDASGNWVPQLGAGQYLGGTLSERQTIGGGSFGADQQWHPGLNVYSEWGTPENHPLDTFNPNLNGWVDSSGEWHPFGYNLPTKIIPSQLTQTADEWRQASGPAQQFVNGKMYVMAPGSSVGYWQSSAGDERTGNVDTGQPTGFYFGDKFMPGTFGTNQDGVSTPFYASGPTTSSAPQQSAQAPAPLTQPIDQSSANPDPYTQQSILGYGQAGSTPMMPASIGYQNQYANSGYGSWNGINNGATQTPLNDPQQKALVQSR